MRKCLLVYLRLYKRQAFGNSRLRIQRVYESLLDLVHKYHTRSDSYSCKLVQFDRQQSNLKLQRDESVCRIGAEERMSNKKNEALFVIC